MCNKRVSTCRRTDDFREVVLGLQIFAGQFFKKFSGEEGAVWCTHFVGGQFVKVVVQGGKYGRVATGRRGKAKRRVTRFAEVYISMRHPGSFVPPGIRRRFPLQ